MLHEDWRNILSISHRFDVENAFQDAVSNLDIDTYYLDTTDRLCLALKYNISHWIRPTLQSLIQSIKDVTQDEEMRLRSFHPSAFRELVQTRNAIMKARHKLLIKPPKILHIALCKYESSQPSRCTAVWDHLWREACLSLIAVTEWMAPRLTLLHVKSAVEMLGNKEGKGGVWGCCKKTLEDVEKRGVLWSKEEALEEVGMHAILGPNYSLPRTVHNNDGTTDLSTSI